jgi:multidrug efflux pump subunit AcrA (membrane-fusion protein)
VRVAAGTRALAVAGALLAVLVACGSAPARAPETATVHRGSITETVSATGALSGATANGPGSVAVIPFQESDAANIIAGQRARVTLTAVPGLELDGSVLAVAPGGVDISGVTNYYVTVVLTQGDPRLRAGQTVEVSVTTASVDNTLVVPDSAVIRQGGRSYVDTPGPDGKPVRIQFQAGAAGGGNTQVLSGLGEGQVVLLTTPAAGTSGTG